jgi:putative aldouronate transport system permease protein
MKLRKRSAEDNILDTFVYVSLVLVFIVTLYPFLNIAAISFNNPQDTMKGGIYLLPREFSLQNYSTIFFSSNILNATFMSVLKTVVGAITSLVSMLMVAYTITRKNYFLRKQVSIILILTMYINGGLIPIYFLTKSLGLINNFLVYILPPLINVFNLLVIRTYMNNLDNSFVESAEMDGAGHMQILFKIVAPICKPAIATIALFVIVYQWNSWYPTFLYCSSNKNLSTLQYELMRLLKSASAASGSAKQAMSVALGSTDDVNRVTPKSIRAAMTIVATVPVMMVYPFLQKYFVAGMTLGGVKG